jgi:hypothetical protein
MASSSDLKAIYTEAYPLIEQQLDLADLIAGLREKATAIGLDWSQIKALLKAQIQDERDETGGRKRVRKIIDKAEHASAYADMLGLANMNEKNFSSAGVREFAKAEIAGETVMGVRLPSHDPLTGEIHDTQDQPETATVSGRTAQVCGEGMAPPLPAGAADAVRSTPAASVSDAIARKDHQSVSPSSPDGSASTESAAGKVSGPAQPSPPKQAEPIKAGEGASPSSPAILSDEEVVPAFMKDKPGCLKLRDGHCKISFATEALCAECADKRARAMA